MSRGSTFAVALEHRVGFEPTNMRVATAAFGPLRYLCIWAADEVRTRSDGGHIPALFRLSYGRHGAADGIRTHTGSVLNRFSLPLEYGGIAAST